MQDISDLSKEDLESFKELINTRLNELKYDEVKNTVKNLPNLINLKDINEVHSVRILSERFMLFDTLKHMREVEHMLIGKEIKGYTLKQVGEAFEFFKKIFN